MPPGAGFGIRKLRRSAGFGLIPTFGATKKMRIREVTFPLRTALTHGKQKLDR